MDHERFDALSRALASARPRRGVLGLILGATILGHGSSVFAEPGKAKGKSRSKDGDQGHETGKGRSHTFGKACDRLACESEGEVCCNGGSCSCGGAGNCCPGHCFQEVDDRGEPIEQGRRFCCPKPKDGGIMCEDEKGEVVCCRYNSTISEKENCDSCTQLGTSWIAGSYRRR